MQRIYSNPFVLRYAFPFFFISMIKYTGTNKWYLTLYMVCASAIKNEK